MRERTSARLPQERAQWLRLRLGLLLRREIPWSLKLDLADAAQRAARGEQSPDDHGEIGGCRRALEAALARQPGKVRLRVLRALDASHREVERELERANDAEVDLLLPEDPHFPSGLLDLTQPPLLLYAKRTPGTQTAHRSIGIVGPRNADSYGLETATSFAADFAAAGVQVVSGFARGVDIACHRATFGLGTTWAVLGCGVDVAYPKQHHRDADRIVDHGGWVLSEFPLGEAPQPWHFPLRNRLIAALSDCLLVIQAGERSGSLITAHAALELGRDVWAVPGRIDHIRCRGSNRLIRDGAGVALESRDLLESLHCALDRTHEPSAQAPLPPTLGNTAVRIHRHLSDGPSDLENLQRALGEPVPSLLAGLGELEIEGYVQRGPEGTYAVTS